MMAYCKQDGDRYIVYNKHGKDGARLGFVRRNEKAWNAVDTTMEHTRDFPTRAAAVRWLDTLPFDDDD